MPLERQTCSSKKVHENVRGGASKEIKKNQENNEKSQSRSQGLLYAQCSDHISSHLNM